MVGQQKLYSAADQNEQFVKEGRVKDQRYLSRKTRCLRYGFDCEESLVWTGWEPGGEYIKKLVIKNVAQKQQTFKARARERAYACARAEPSIRRQFRKSPSATFSLPFSNPKKLSPGVSFAIPVAFRPSEHIAYDDEVGSHRGTRAHVSTKVSTHCLHMSTRRSSSTGLLARFSCRSPPRSRRSRYTLADMFADMRANTCVQTCVQTCGQTPLDVWTWR